MRSKPARTLPNTRRFDFVVIIPPREWAFPAGGYWLLRPITDAAVAFIESEYAEHKKGIHHTLMFDSLSPFHKAIEALSERGMRIEIL